VSKAEKLDLTEIESDAGVLRSAGTVARSARFDVYLFWSFDLVGSTALKAKSFETFHWVDVIRDFYHQCEALLQRLGVEDARVWKYIGDEVLFYRRIVQPAQIEDTVRAIFRGLDGYTTELATSTKYAEVVPYVSIKAFAWLVPVMSYVHAAGANDEFADVAGSIRGDDQIIEENGRIDFLGPNIDAGFRLAQFARKKQLVLSGALAAYLVESRASENNLRIADFAALKGVAGGALYPGIWYRENWGTIARDFTYEERHTDPLVKRMCENGQIPLTTLEEVRLRFEGLPYFFDRALIHRVIELSNEAAA